MKYLTDQRCLNHSAREAAARCPECKRYFCRECVVEHDDRVICTNCLKDLTKTSSARQRTFGRAIRGIEIAAGILLAWFFFFFVGESLSRLPDSFHDGEIWRAPAENSE